MDVDHTSKSGYDVRKSQVGDTSMGDWLMCTDGRLLAVPGVGKAAKALLNEVGVLTWHQLVGQFLLLGGPGLSQQEHCEKMWRWLEANKINQHRADIVCSLAEKAHMMLPDIFD
jgi:hypothetical protein